MRLQHSHTWPVGPAPSGAVPKVIQLLEVEDIMTDQMGRKDGTAQTIAQLVGPEGMPVRPSDEAFPHVTTDDWGEVLVADYEAVQIALAEGAVIRDPESGFLRVSSAL
jgi:hypothetical protein